MNKPYVTGAYLAPTATIVGDVTLAEDVNVWYGAVLRGDAGAIAVGEGTNIQDLCVLHEGAVVGKRCTVGHSAIVHGCTIGDGCLVGMGSIILNGAVIGDRCIIGAGAVVTGKMNAPAGSLILGNPAKVVKELSEAQQADIQNGVQLYIDRAHANLPKAE